MGDPSAFQIIPDETRARGLQFIGTAVAVYVVLHLVGFHRFFANDAEGVGALLRIIGTLYSVVYAFAIYVIWGQFAAVENEIVKESGALSDLVLFSKPLKEITREPIVRSVRAYAHGVVESEWATLSHQKSTEKTDRLFSSVISSVTEAKLEDASGGRVHERLLEISNQASAHRQERLAVSAKRMPRTLMLFVTVTACTIPFLFLFFPFQNLALGIISIAIATMLLFFANFVLTDLDNPFEGTWNVNSNAFNELANHCR